MSDIATLITAVAALIAAVASLAAVFVGIKNRGELRATHILVNSRLTELIKAARAEGRVEERDEAKKEGKE